MEVPLLKDGDGLRIGNSASQLSFFGVTPVDRPAALTTADATAIDGTYGAPEQGVLDNVRTRLGELEDRLQELGLIS